MKKFVLLCVGSILLTGCFSGRSPDSKFFMLESVSNENAVSLNKTSLLVEPIVIPDLIYKPQIVLKEKDTPEIVISEFDRWGEPLPDVLRQTLVDDLQSYLPNAYIKPELYSTNTSGYKYRLSVEVNHFIGAFDGVAVLDVWWTLKDKNGKTIVREKSKFETKMDGSYQDYIVVQSRMLADLAKTIALKVK